MTDSPAPPAAPPRGRRFLLLLGLLLLAVASWWIWRWATAPALPEFSSAGIDPPVVEAIQVARDSVRRAPWSAAAWGQLGMVLLGNKFEDEAVLPLLHAEQCDPHDPRWPYLRGVALLNRDPDEAIPCLRRAVDRCRDDADCSPFHLRLAETLAANGRPDEAEAAFRAVPAGSLTPCVDYGLAVLALQRGDLQQAKRRLLRCVSSPFTRQRAAAQLLAVHKRLGEPLAPTTAEPLPPDPPWTDPYLTDCLALAVGKDPRLKLASRLEQQGQLDRALDILRPLAHDYPDSQTLLALGMALGRRGFHAESEEVLRRTLQRDPSLVRAHHFLSLALFGQAERLLQQGRKTDSTAKLEEAARAARRALDLNPQNGEVHFQLGLTLWALRRHPEAVAAFREAVATRPNLADAHLWLGRTLAESGHKDEALRHLRDAARYAAPDDPRPRQWLDLILADRRFPPP